VSTSTPDSWFKSSYSGGNSNCLETGPLPEGMAIRDSKNAPGPTLAIRAHDWTSFLTAIKDGTFPA
jgi:Domain of unknown function (DUF397)